MSTKATIIYGEGFALYEEVFDPEHVYLSLQKADFEATPAGIRVAIPLHVWEVVREHTCADLSLVDQSDAEILAYVEDAVDTRIRQYEESDEDGRLFLGMFGLGVYGAADEPREQQIENGVRELTERREKQRVLKGRIDQIRAQHRERTQR